VATSRPISDRRNWRLALARVHPDAGGTDELFCWLVEVRDVVCEHLERREARRVAHISQGSRAPARPEAEPNRLPFPPADFDALTARALREAAALPEPFAGTLASLSGCYGLRSGRPGIRERRGATYRQLAYAAHLCGMTKQERVRWYDICAEIPLSERHASHIIEVLKSRGAAA
jgi:hypothetical protein